jgi:hypothetical protein
VKSLGFAPVCVIEAIVSVPPPPLVRLTLCGELVFPTLMVPKLRDVALSLAIGAGAVGAVAAASVTMNVAPFALKFPDRIAPVFAATT